MVVVTLSLWDLLADGLLVARGPLPQDAGVANHPENNLAIDGPSHQRGHPCHDYVALIWTIDGLGSNQGRRSTPALPLTLLMSTSLNISKIGLLRRLPGDELSDASRSMIASYAISITDLQTSERSIEALPNLILDPFSPDASWKSQSRVSSKCHSWSHMMIPPFC